MRTRDVQDDFPHYPLAKNTKFCEIVSAVQTADHERLLGYLNEILEARSLTISHPIRSNITTLCYSSIELRFGNVLCFADEDGGNRWFWIQTCSLVDGALIDGDCYQLHGNEFGDNAVTSIAYDLQERVNQDTLFGQQKPFTGALVSHARPAHYFYDQLVNLPHLHAVEVCTTSKNFFDPSLLGYPCRTFSEEGWAIRPQTIPANYHEAASIEVQLRKWALAASGEEYDGKFVLWIGVADEKRRWREQIEGYAALVDHLAERVGRPMTVLVDGFTAFNGEEIPAENDMALFEQIKERVTTDVTWVSLIGKDYATKLRYGIHMDAFVTYVGTQSMVPLRICRAMGILHSNRIYGSGLSLEEFEGVQRVPVNEVLNGSPSPSLKSDYVSYHMAWESVFNKLVGLLDGMPKTKLEVPGLDTLRVEDEDQTEDAFGSLGTRVSYFKQAPDILREVAMSFEASGDLATAHSIMSKALQLRPHGSVIKQKVKDYQQQLKNTQNTGKN